MDGVGDEAVRYRLTLDFGRGFPIALAWFNRFDVARVQVMHRAIWVDDQKRITNGRDEKIIGVIYLVSSAADRPNNNRTEGTHFQMLTDFLDRHGDKVRTAFSGVNQAIERLRALLGDS